MRHFSRQQEPHCWQEKERTWLGIRKVVSETLLLDKIIPPVVWSSFFVIIIFWFYDFLLFAV